MAKLKYDVSGSDPDKALAAGEQPKPGVYTAKIASLELGYKKGDDGKPDKTQPRWEIQTRIDDPKAKSPDGESANGALLFDYIAVPPNPSAEKSEWKLDQFLQAVMPDVAKKKRKGEVDTDKIVGKVKVKVRVKSGSNNNGDYRAETAAWMPFVAKDGDDDDDLGGGGDDDGFGDDDPDNDPDGTTDDPGGDDDDPFAEATEDDPDGGDDTVYSREELEAMSPTDLAKVAAEEFDFSVKAVPGTGKQKIKNVIDKILEMQDADPFGD